MVAKSVVLQNLKNQRDVYAAQKYENASCLCVYQHNEALSGGNSADTDNDFS